MRLQFYIISAIWHNLLESQDLKYFRKIRNLFYSTLLVQTPVYCSNLSLHLQLLLLFSCHLGLHYILSLLILLQQHKLLKQCYLSVKTNNLIKTLPFFTFFCIQLTAQLEKLCFIALIYLRSAFFITISSLNLSCLNNRSSASKFNSNSSILFRSRSWS